MVDNRLFRKFLHLFFLFKRPMTLGVRIFVENDAKEVLLVRHTYVKGWYLPGGGVEIGETCVQAAKKELWEETGLEVLGEPQLLGIYQNNNASRRDHVALFRAREWREEKVFEPNREIAEIGFFPIDRLPEDTTEATLKRIVEIRHGETASQYW